MTRTPNLPSMNTKGFTLVETMVAVTIITLAVAGPLFTANRAIVAAQSARYQLTAVYLAQEGVEYMRAIRDGYYLSNAVTAWTDFITASYECHDPNFCTLDPTEPMGIGSGFAIQLCSGACTQLYLSNGIYTQDNSYGTITPFTRTIQLETVSGTEEKVTATVSWDYHGATQSVKITDILTPWQ